MRFNGLAWTGPAVSYLATRRPGKKNKALRLLYDVSELGHAWVCDPQQPDYPPQRIEAIDPSYQDGLTMHLHELVKAELRIKRLESINYRAAREARIRVLRELANANSKAKRKRREIAAEHGDFKPSRSRPAPPFHEQTSEAAPPSQLHQKTPAEYQVVEAHHATGTSKRNP